jgi:hypothetical protein
MPIQEGGTFSPVRNIVSPGVFTRENDLSGVAAGVANIGGAIVAPFAKGPAFSPTLLTDVNTLQNQFGVPDGVYYGPYTAAQYLQEQGLVTVVRVGPLTGYEQKYPFAVWAVKGTYNRNTGSAALNSGSSFVYFSGSAANQYRESISWNNPTGSGMIINSASVTVTFVNGAADDVSFDPHANSGSILYHGQTITLGAATLIDAVANVSQSQFSASISNGTFSASITGPVPVHFPQADSPFTSVALVSASLSVNLGTCGFPLILISGVVTGAIGKYTGFTPAGTASFDPCILPNGAWVTQSGADTRLLAVLADTQAGGIQDLVAPGFNGSALSLTNPIASWSGQGGVSDIPTDFNLTLKNSNSTSPYGVYQFSLDNNNSHYITNVFDNDPTAGNPDTQVVGQKIEAAYLYKIYENSITEIVDEKTQWFVYGAAIPTSSFTGEPLNFTDQYSRDLTNGDSVFSITNAVTPWIVSQKIAPWQSGSTTPTRFELFRIQTISDGTYTNKQFKVEISNVKLAGQVAGSDYGSFTLTLRKFSDTDKRPIIVEQYNNLNLDPTSANFIARMIGDRYNYINFNGKVIEFGTYPNNSKNIRVEMTQNNYPISAIPYGFEAFITPTNGAMGYWTPQMKYTKASVYGLSPGKYPSGITFDDAPTGADAELFSLYPEPTTGVGAADDNTQYMAPIPSFNSSGATYSSIGRNILFALDDDYELYGVGTGSFLSGSNAIPTTYDAVNEPTYVKMRKFVLGFQGGFDGQSPSIPINVGGNIIAGNTQGLDCTTVSSAGSIAYAQCIAALSNADQYDINLIAAPGIVHQEHPYVTNLIVDMCEARGDTFYIMDLYVDDGNPSSGQIDQVVSFATEYDTNYAAAYYPWVKILDTYNNKIVTVPPSVVLPAVYAASDNVAAEWFAPAGLNRGGIAVATQVTDRTTHEERDSLYEGKVNPIAAFPGSGIVVWGQKTLQNADSALNRINVRRLLINIKKFFASTSNYLVFEQNVAATRNKFLSIVNPYLESVQQRSGLYAFFVKMDDANNTPDIIDQNILYGQIYLKPTKTAEFIILDFNILPTGASFPNA